MIGCSSDIIGMEDQNSMTVTKPHDGREKRRYPRRTFEKLAGVMIQGTYGIENTFELGELGMSFETTLALKDRDNMVINFAIPGGYIVMTRAEVKYQVRKGDKVVVGVEFINISFEDRRKVRDFIAQRRDAFIGVATY